MSEKTDSTGYKENKERSLSTPKRLRQPKEKKKTEE
jgi:hypothetical protein